MSGTLEAPEIGQQNSTQDPKIKTAIETLNGLLNSENKIASTALASGLGAITWYTPKVIATEQSRESTSFGTLGTADEITGVVLPTNGLILIGYSANVKSSAGSAGRAAVFLGPNQLKSSGGTPAVQEASTFSTTLCHFSTFPGGLAPVSHSAAGADVTTGQALGPGEPGAEFQGGLCPVFAAAGTYAISVQFKANSGSVIAKERRLYVAVLG